MTVIYKFKCLLIGAPAVGKTSLMHRFVDDVFSKNYAATIGAQFLTKSLKLSPDKENDDEAQLNLWDIAGQPRFLDLRTTFYRGTDGALIIFDLSRENTFEEISVWHSEMAQTLNREIPFILIGNKSDLKRKVKANEAKKFAKERNSLYLETSAKTGKNVEDAFLELTRLIAASKEGIDLPKKALRKAIKKKGGDSFIVKSKVKEYIKSNGCNSSRDIIDGDALNNVIIKILDKAIARTKANGRKTVKGKDI